MKGCVITQPRQIHVSSCFYDPQMTYYVIQMLDIIQQQQQYPILGPRRYANRGQKKKILKILL